MTKNSRRKKSTRARATAHGTNFTQASDNSHRGASHDDSQRVQLHLNEHFMSDRLRETLSVPGTREQLAQLGVVLDDAQPEPSTTNAAPSLTYNVGPSPVLGGQPMPISFHASPTLVVGGPARSGKTDWLDSFIHQTRHQQQGQGLRATVDIIDYDGSLARRWAHQDGIRIASGPQDATALLDDVMQDLRKRHDIIHQLLATSDDLLPRFVVIDDWHHIAAEPDASTIFEVLLGIIRDGADRGIHVILSGETLRWGDDRLTAIANVVARAGHYATLTFGLAGEPLVPGRGVYRASDSAILNPIVMPGAEQPGDRDGLDSVRQRLGRLLRPGNADKSQVVFANNPEGSIDDTIERTLAAKSAPSPVPSSLRTQETYQRVLDGDTSTPQAWDPKAGAWQAPAAPTAPSPTPASWRYDRRQRITTITAAAPAHSIDPRPLLRAVGTAIAVHYEPQSEQLDLHIDADGTCDFVLLGRASADAEAIDGGDFVIRDHTADELSTHLTDAERAAVERWMRDAWAYLNEHFLAFNDLWDTVSAALRRGEHKMALNVDLGWRPLGDLNIRHDVNATPKQWSRGNVIRRYRDGRYRYFASVLPLTAEGEYLGSGATGGIGVSTVDGIDHEQLQFFHQQAFSIETAREAFEFTLVHAALSLPTPNI